MDNTKSSITASNVPDGETFAVQESVESLDGTFDGTANLTVEGGTILIPAPTADPRDPLNFSTPHKYFILGILIAYAVCGLCIISALGALIVFMMEDYQRQGVTPGQISTLLTYPPLFLGIGNIFSMPLALAYGRRPVLLLSLILLFISAILCATNKSFAWHLGARSLAGFAGAQCEALVFLVIQDTFFLHQRGRTFQIFSSFEVMFNSGLTIASSYMAEALGWRSWYWLFTALSGACLVLAFFFVPETAYTRPLTAFMGTHVPEYIETTDDGKQPEATHRDSDASIQPLTTLSERKLDTVNYEPRTFRSDMRIFVVKPDFGRAITTWKQVCTTFLFPHVLWVALMNAFFQGSEVCLQITYGRALVSPPYNWAKTDVSLVQIGQIIMAMLCYPFVGWFSDAFILRMSRRNKGVHEPEYRLPPLVAPILLCTMMGIIYGFTLQNPEKFHWFAITFTVNVWLFLLLASSTAGTTYLLDAHPARAGAVLIIIPVTRGLVGFGTSYHTVDYINAIGPAKTFGILSAIVVAFGVVGVYFYVWGKGVRHYFSRWAN